jgi:hypothetical protein
MFKNPGRKIIVFGKILFTILLIAGLGASLYLGYYFYFVKKIDLIENWYYYVCVLGGVLLSPYIAWGISIFAVGFGELIDNSAALRKNSEEVLLNDTNLILEDIRRELEAQAKIDASNEESTLENNDDVSPEVKEDEVNLIKNNEEENIEEETNKPTEEVNEPSSLESNEPKVEENNEPSLEDSNEPTIETKDQVSEEVETKDQVPEEDETKEKAPVEIDYDALPKVESVEKYFAKYKEKYVPNESYLKGDIVKYISNNEVVPKFTNGVVLGVKENTLVDIIFKVNGRLFLSSLKTENFESLNVSIYNK